MRTRQNIFREKIVPLFLLKYFGDPLWSKLKIDHPANTAYMYPASDLTKKKKCVPMVSFNTSLKKTKSRKRSHRLNDIFSYVSPVVTMKNTPMMSCEISFPCRNSQQFTLLKLAITRSKMTQNVLLLRSFFLVHYIILFYSGIPTPLQRTTIARETRVLFSPDNQFSS